MKYLFTFFYFFVTCQLIMAQHVAEGTQKDLIQTEGFTLADFNLHGSVKNITETVYQKKLNGGYTQGTTSTLVFDTSGKLTESKEQLMFEGTPMGDVIKKYKYGKAAGPLLIEYPDENGKVTETFTFRYDSKGNLLATEYKTSQGTEKNIFEYDGKNRLVTKKMTAAGGKTFASITRFSYNDRDLIIAKEYESVSEKTKTKYLYGYVPGSLYPQTYSTEGSAELTRNTYNDKGDIIAQEAISASGTVLKDYPHVNIYNNYVYDKQLNWTKKTIAGVGVDGYTERKLEYYKKITPGEYAQALQDAMGNSLKQTNEIMAAAFGKTKPTNTLLVQLTALQQQLVKDMGNVEKIETVAGNDAKKNTIELFKYLALPTTQNDIKSMINDPDNSKNKYVEVAKQLHDRIGTIKTELAKMK